jgi:hypothetical protein
MQQVQRREGSDQISWARAVIFAIGFFFITALLIGQVPGFIYLQLTAASLEGAEQGSLALGLTCLAAFVVIQVIVMLFDPKPVVPPIIFTVLGLPLAVGGLALMVWATATGCDTSQAVATCNQYFPGNNTHINPMLGGNFFWFQPGSIDFVMIGAILLGLGVAMIFYSQLAIREQSNPDRRDLGTTPTIRLMLIAASILLVAFMVFFTFVNDQGLAYQLTPNPTQAFWTQKIIDYILATILGLAIFLTLGAFALRLHYLMRPVRKRTMSVLYAVGALGFAQIGALLILFWLVLYPLITWMHSWTFIGLGDYLTICSNKLAIPASCFFSPQAGYIVDGIVTTNFFIMLAAAVWIWRSNRNLVVIAGVVTTAVLALATLLVHLYPTEFLIALLLCGGALVLATVWTSVARREFAIVGENNLGCLGQWLLVGTCLFVYLGAFAFFSIPGFLETEPNIPFVSGSAIPPHVAAGQPPILTQSDAMVMLVIMAILATIHFYFLTRNRYRV